jgi:DNA polymerase-1
MATIVPSTKAGEASLSEIRDYVNNIKPIVITGPYDIALLEPVLAAFRASKRLAIDTETTGLCPIINNIRTIQLAIPAHVIVIDTDNWRDIDDTIDWTLAVPRLIKELLETSASVKILQNAAFDLNMLRAEGVLVGGPIFDTMIASKVVNNGLDAGNDLGSIVKRELAFELPKELQKAKWSADITHEMIQYAARDALVLLYLTSPLRNKLKKSVRATSSLYDVFKLEMLCVRPIGYMQYHGFRLDLSTAFELRRQLNDEAAALKLKFLEDIDSTLHTKYPEDPEKWLPRDEDGTFNTREKASGSIRLGTKKYPGFNCNSPKQLALKLTDCGIILPPNPKAGSSKKASPYSLDQNLLAFLRDSHPLIDTYLTWKEKATLGSHIESLIQAVAPQTGRIHANYKQVGTDTSRLSCSSPNLQNVPRNKLFRSLFIAPEGYVLVGADYSQLELRVIAHLSNEPKMIEAYKNNADLHVKTVTLLTGKSADLVVPEDRVIGKAVNFGLNYGAGPATLRRQAKSQYGLDMEHNTAVLFVSKYREGYPTLYAWQKEVGGETTKAVFTAIGRRRFVVGAKDKYTVRINTRVQGTAGDIVKIAIADLYEQIVKSEPEEAYLISQVHDELIMCVREGTEDKWKKILEDVMVAASDLILPRVPMVVEAHVGNNWAELK